jgi:hypothetical protein
VPEQETPDSLQGTPGADDTSDWQKRYTDLQSEYTRSQQENSQLRQYREWADALKGDDEQAALAAAEALGLSYDEPADDGSDPFAAYEKRIEKLERLEQQREQKLTQSAQEEKDLETLDAGLGAFEKRIGRKLEEQEVKLLVSHAVVNRDDDGLPGINSAVDLYDQIDRTGQTRWVNTKRVNTPAQGVEGEETPALDSHAERVASMLANFHANQR